MEKRALGFYDAKAAKAFRTKKYELVVEKTEDGPVIVAVARSPYTGALIKKVLGERRRGRK